MRYINLMCIHIYTLEVLLYYVILTKLILYLSKIQYSKYTFVWKERYVEFSNMLTVEVRFNSLPDIYHGPIEFISH